MIAIVLLDISSGENCKTTVSLFNYAINNPAFTEMVET